MSSKSVYQIFRFLFQTRDINNIVLRGAFFNRYVQLESSFSDVKTSAVKSETYFSRESIENERSKVLKRNSIIGRSWCSEKLFIIKNYLDNAHGNVLLTVENV